MKTITKLNISLFLFFLTINLYAQETCDAIANGPWDNSDTWNCSNGVLLPDETISIINIDDGFAVTIEGLEGLFIPPFPPDTLNVTINFDGIIDFDGISSSLFFTHN